MQKIIELEAEEGFVETKQVKEIANRALRYLKAGYAAHLSGPTGTGKTTLAMHLAHRLGRPVSILFGDEEIRSSELVGGQFGYHKKKMVDNFVSRVVKTEEEANTLWVDNRLTEACKNGHTLIYDEFNRSKPEANNALLSVLEEGILTLPPSSGELNPYVKVHPGFRAIFTSNPEEYVGVHKAQDALLDRMVTVCTDYFDFETELAVMVARTGLALEEARGIVRVIRSLRNSHSSDFHLSLRAGIIIGKVAKMERFKVTCKDLEFRRVCIDVLAGKSRNGLGFSSRKKIVSNLIRKHCP